MLELMFCLKQDFNDASGMENAIHSSVTVSWITYAAISVFGYLSFYENTQGTHHTLI